MSEQESSRIEVQIAELRELMQQNMATTQHDMSAMREDVTLRQRVESIEGTVIVAMREGFNSLRSYLDDLNYEVADNERSTRLLKRRVARLERKDDNDR
jgi:hypothetical protein